MIWNRSIAVVLIGVFLTFIPAVACAQEAKQSDAVVPAMKDTKGWLERHEKFVDIAKKGNVDLLFLGDSITQGWEGNGKEAWKKTFEPLKAANFGISGDRTQHVLWRITKGKELEGIQPKLAVIMIGTNNVSTNSAREIADGVHAIVTELRNARPNCKVLLLAVFPRSEKPGKEIKDDAIKATDLQPKIKAINEYIAKLDDGKNVFYLDIGAKLSEADGGLSRKVMYDYLHLSAQGYDKWAAAIEPKVKELLK